MYAFNTNNLIHKLNCEIERNQKANLIPFIRINPIFNLILNLF